MSSLPFLFCIYKLNAAKLVLTEWICNSKLHRANLQYNITNSLILSDDSFTFKYFFGTQLLNIVKIWNIWCQNAEAGPCVFFLTRCWYWLCLKRPFKLLRYFWTPSWFQPPICPFPILNSNQSRLNGVGGITSPLFLPPFCAIIRFHFGNSVSSQKRETSASAHRCQNIFQHSIQGKGLQCIQYNYRRGHTNTEPRFWKSGNLRRIFTATWKCTTQRIPNIPPLFLSTTKIWAGNSTVARSRTEFFR